MISEIRSLDMKVFSNLPSWGLILGVLIAVVSLYQAVTVRKTSKERAVAIVVALLAVGLLVVQFLAASASQAKSDISQRTLQNATLGSSLCPTVMADHFGGQRPHGLSVFNPDKDANIYDLVLYVQEGERTADGRGWNPLQQRTLRYPTIPAGSGTPSLTFEFLSLRKTSYLQFDLSTRRKICSGLIVLQEDGNGNWSAKTFPVHEGPLTAHKSEIPAIDGP
jgi:hypothetical protein